MKPTFEPVRHLERSDKHFVGAGEGLLYAPPFPLFPDRLGFWDTVHYHLYPFSPGFTVSILEAESGTPLPLRVKRREWTPGRLRLTHESAGGLAVTEKKAASEWDALISQVSVRNLSSRPRSVRLVQWTALETLAARPVSGLQLDRGAFRATVRENKQGTELGWSLGGKGAPRSGAAQLVEPQPAGWNANQPFWELTPFRERLRRADSKLPDELRLGGVTTEGLIYVAQERLLELAPGDVATVTFGLAFGPDAGEARENLERALQPEDPVHEADRRWRAFFDEVPRLECSDPHLLTAYWYRWYGLRLNSFTRPFRAYRHPAVCEGIEYFRSPISYSAQCHMREMRWHPSGAHARGSLLNFIEHQLPDGSLAGHLHPSGPVKDTFYHADWGGALLEVLAVHEDAALLEAAYPALARYAEHFDRDRDPRQTALYDVFSQYETGQEYMSRYVAARPEEASRVADWDRTLRLKGVDATVYAHQLKLALALLASRLGRRDEAARWEAGRQRTAAAVREHMWSNRLGMFQDLHHDSLEPTGVESATCFYPYLTSIAGPEHVEGLKRSLLDPGRFWTPWPVPASSLRDPRFDAEGLWQGKRHNCPWNGRVWPMTNSHLVDALFRTASLDQELARPAGELFTRAIRLLFLDGDPGRPACYEHYNPFTGDPSSYRGIDDYMHSWVVDLILRHAAGLVPTQDGVTFAPRALGLEGLRVTGARIRGKVYEVEIEGNRAVLREEGRVIADQQVGLVARP